MIGGYRIGRGSLPGRREMGGLSPVTVALRFVANHMAFGLALLLLPAAPAPAQTPPLTPAERAAVDQRPLTQAEKDRRDADCRLELAGGEALRLGEGAAFRRLRLGPQTALALIAARRPPAGQRRPEVKAFPLLPNGGIGGRDFCESVMLFPADAADGTFSMLALRLRPGLDGAADYPAAWRAAQDNAQLFAYPAGDYAVATIPGVSRALAAFSAVSADPRVETARPALYIGDMLLIPLKPGPKAD